MMLQDKSQICYVVMRSDEEYQVPCAVFTDLITAENRVEAYNQKFKDEEIEGYIFYLSCTALYNE